MPKPISLVNISFFDEKDKRIVTESEAKVFESFERMQQYIESRKQFWQNLYNIKIKVEPDSVETMTNSEGQQVLKYVCDFLKINYTRASSKLQDREFVDARRFAINICFDRKMLKTGIAKALGLNHATIYHHLKMHKGFMEVQSGYKEKYEDMLNYVMEHIGGNYREDGSGIPVVKEIKK